MLKSFDIKKTFDTVWPAGILLKTKEIKIGGRVFKYIANLFKVNHGGSKSMEYKTDIGVPQGSPLSSTLFLIAFQYIIWTLLKELIDWLDMVHMQMIYWFDVQIIGQKVLISLDYEMQLI